MARVGVGVRLAAPLMSVVLMAACTGPVTTGANVRPGSHAGAGTRVEGTGIVVAEGHGWTSASLDGPVPAAGSCHLRKAADGEPLPDPACTPGAVDRAVTDADVGSTVCRTGIGYTSSVRPPHALTRRVKKELLAAYGIPASQIHNYELDHLVELAAGGASDVRNLWPEPNTLRTFRRSKLVHNDKDAVEAYTFHAICAGRVSVTAVQKAMATDWTTAVKVLGLPAIPADSKG